MSRDIVSKFLATCVVFAGTLYKIPQVLKIYKARSAKGVSLTMITTDAWTTMVETAYSYGNGQPFLDWGEAPSQLICSTSVALQILYYQRHVRKLILAKYATTFLLFTGVVMHAPLLLGKRIGFQLLKFLKTINMFITFISKFPQIMENYKTKSTGQLSAPTMATGCLGGIVRLYTLFQSPNGIDPLMVLNQAASLVMNATIVGQILYYGRTEKVNTTEGIDRNTSTEGSESSNGVIQKDNESKKKKSKKKRQSTLDFFKPFDKHTERATNLAAASAAISQNNTKTERTL